jgi:Spy/CpxP family protein refolding chaperone
MKPLRCLLLVASFITVAAPLTQAATKAVAPIVVPTTPPGSMAILLGVDGVRKELGLTSLQRAILNDIRGEYRDEARAVVAKVGADLESKKQAEARLEKLTATYDKRALRALNDDQRARLSQIQAQILGGYMLLSPKLQQELGLTAKQKQWIVKIWAKGQKYTSKVNGWFEKGEISYYERLLYLRENRLDRSDDFLKVLTKAQRAKFDQIAGPKFVG